MKKKNDVPAKKKKSSLKKKKPQESSHYFDGETEEAVRLYVGSDDQDLRNKIYTEKINAAFLKIAENVSNIFGAYRVEDVRDVINEIVVNLMMNLDKYDPDSGSKAFSYFTVAAKNYVFQLLKKSSSRRKFWDNFQNRNYLFERGINNCPVDPLANIEKRDFVRGIIYDLSGSLDSSAWTNVGEAKVVRAVITLLEDNIINKKDALDIYSRKGVYVYLREITLLDTKRIARTMSKIRKRYSLYKKIYYSGERIPELPVQTTLMFSGSASIGTEVN